MLPLLVLLVTIAGAWYLLIVRPQREQQGRHGRLVERLQVGDHVLTVGGIYGRVVDVGPAGVELELGPGTVTRIATDGIARIVHESHLGPTTPISDNGRPPVDDMQQDQTPDHAAQHQGFAAPPAPTFAAPAGQASAYTTYRAQIAGEQPLAAPGFAGAPMPVHAPAQPAAVHAPVQPAAGYAPAHQAAAQPAPILRPWGDVAPAGSAPAAPQAYAPAPVAPQAYASTPGVQQYAPTAVSAPVAPAAPAPSGSFLPPVPQISFPPRQAAAAPGHEHAPAHVPAVAPTAAHYAAPYGAPVAAPMPAPVPPHHYAEPVHHAAPVMPGHAPAHAQPAHQLMVQAPVHEVGQHAVEAPAAGAPTAVGGTRKHSQAPQGMGSTLRLDDPSLIEPLTRARSERGELAEDYRRVSAPLVDLSEPAPAQAYAAPAAPLPAPTMAGVVHAEAPSPYAAAPSTEFVAPPGVGVASAMPRPNVAHPVGDHDPALFQRRTPMTQAAPGAPAAHPVAAHA